MTEAPLLFAEELGAFESRKTELLQLCFGKFALFKGSAFGGAYDTAQAAYQEGLRRYGNTEFLVRQVQPRSHHASIPALALGLTHACP